MVGLSGEYLRRFLQAQAELAALARDLGMHFAEHSTAFRRIDTSPTYADTSAHDPWQYQTFHYPEPFHPPLAA